MTRPGHAADVSSMPTIVGSSGDTSGATLRVVRPGTMPDDAAATYLIQAYSDAQGNTKVGGGASALVPRPCIPCRSYAGIGPAKHKEQLLLPAECALVPLSGYGGGGGECSCGCGSCAGDGCAQACVRACPQPTHQPPSARPHRLQVGSEVRGNNSAAGADGKTADTAFAFPYPYTSAAQLYFTVSVVVGTTRSNASALSDAVVVGTCAEAGHSGG